jgi:hypothetical protein
VVELIIDDWWSKHREIFCPTVLAKTHVGIIEEEEEVKHGLIRDVSKS